MGATLTLLLVWVVDGFSRRMNVAGLPASVGLFGITSVVFALSYLRADPVPIWHGLRLEAWGAFVFMALSGITVVVLLVRGKSRNQPILRRRVR
jgi:amino acid permease